MISRFNSVEFLRRECCVFCRYLIGQDATPYLQEKYIAFHQQDGRAEATPSTRFDRLLLRLATRHALGVRLADVYTSRFAKTSALRKKLLLMIGLIECSATTSELLDRPSAGGRGAVLAWAMGKTALYGLLLLVATVLLAPLQVFCAADGGNERVQWWRRIQSWWSAPGQAPSTSRKRL